MERTILVTGGTGQLGRVVVELLRVGGHRVRVASRSAAPSADSHQEDWAVVDYASGAGVLSAMTGIDTVIHCASGWPRGERETMTALLEASRTATPKPHIIYISIVGVDRIPLGYYRTKLAAEKALTASGLPSTILRATQFHTLVASLLKSLSRMPIVLLPKGVSFQPIEIPAVARRLVELASVEPAGRVDDIGGPVVHSLADLAAIYLRAAGKSKKVIEVPIPIRAIKALRTGANLCPDNATPGTTFEEYLTQTTNRTAR